jgi:peptidase MA superfamily protein
MGRLIRWLGAAIAAAALSLVVVGATAAFDGFGASTASSDYGDRMTFSVELDGTRPDRLEILLRTPGSDTSFVAPVTPAASEATYVWDTSSDYVTPNTVVTYQWRAISGEQVVESDPATLRYVDDRPGLDWQSAQLGETTVHWYGTTETLARRFGELTAVGVDRGEALLGTQLAGPVDVFVYQDQADFFGALGPGAREWTGAAAYSDIRTIFMWLGGGSQDYLEKAMVHEVTHIVFHDATDNPYHEPARWLNEGIATWSEIQDAGSERGIVENEASTGGLFAFEAITEQFPIGDRGARVSYAQGTTMVDMIIDRYGADAMAAITAAYRDGASDDEALSAGTGVAADQLYADFFDAFGVEAPSPITAAPIAASDVDRPAVGEVDPGGVEPGAEPPPVTTPVDDRADGGSDLVVLLALGLGVAAAVVVAVVVARRAARRSAG